MKRKLQTKAGKAVYAARKCVVEPVFGQIKQARGFRQFLLRGKQKVKGEWALVCLTHNILEAVRDAVSLRGSPQGDLAHHFGSDLPPKRRSAPLDRIRCLRRWNGPKFVLREGHRFRFQSRHFSDRLLVLLCYKQVLLAPQKGQ